MHHYQPQQHNPMDPQPFYIAQDAHQQPQQPPRRTWGQPQPISFATTAGPEPYISPQRRQQWGLQQRPYGGGGYGGDPYGSPQQQQQPYYGSPYDRSPYGQQQPMGQPYGHYQQQPPMQQQPISPYGGQSAAGYMQSPPMHHLPQSAAPPQPLPPAAAPFRLHDSGGGPGAAALSRTASAGGFGSPAGPVAAATSPIRRASEGPMYVTDPPQQSDLAARQSARESAMSPGGRRLHSSVPAPQVIKQIIVDDISTSQQLMSFRRTTWRRRT